MWGELGMIGHIRFCLDEIECEIEAQDVLGLSTVELADLQDCIASMRAVLDRSESRRRAKRAKYKSDDLLLIRGIDARSADQLAGLGFGKFAAIAALTPKDLATLAAAGISPSRVNAENWIEQAAILATGKLTYFAAWTKRIGNADSSSDGESAEPAEFDARPEETPAVVEAAPAAEIVIVATMDDAEPAVAEIAASDVVVDMAAAVDPAIGHARRSGMRIVGRIAATILMAATLAGIQLGELPGFASLAAVVTGN
jgi:predicted flap endonuclease-1-like 5' DNA nuclease